MRRFITSRHASNRRGKHTREEGAVLVIVVMMLLVISATAAYAVHTTSAELQGAGGTRTAFQTESMAASLADGTLDWVDRVGPAALYRQVTESERAGHPLDLTNVEQAQLATGQFGTRLYASDLATGSSGTSGSGATGLVGAWSLNNGVPDVATGLVDVYDIHRFSGAVAGSRSDGYGNLAFLRATYTARARAQVAVGASVDEAVVDRHVSTSTARAVGTSGPFSM